MSKKVTALVVGLVASLAIVAGTTMQGCGSSGGSSSDYKALCMQGCDKLVSCTPDADATTITAIRTACEADCNKTCSNESARVSAGKACLAMSDCMAFETCGTTTIPQCQMTTGTGGSGTGTGGSGAGGTGTGGTGTGTGGTGTGTGGTGTGTGGTSGGGWTCQDNGTACACAQGSGGTATTCPSSYNCCIMYTTGGTATCSCATAGSTAECAQAASLLGGTQTGHCPP